MKDFLIKDGFVGVPMDANFHSHQTNCERCKQLDIEKPATLALLCLEGSILYKQENSIRIKKPESGPGYTGKKTRITHEEMRKLMVHK